jgi:hypothetical protein
MGTTVKYFRSESLPPEIRKEYQLPDSGTVALEVSVNSPVNRTYVDVSKGRFLDFLRDKVAEAATK